MNIKKEVVAVAMAMFSLSAAGQQAVDYVNPSIGTNGMGHTFPGASTPFGWVQLSPDTDTIPHNVDGVYQKKAYEYCAGYQYRDKTIVGFSHTHLSGTGHSDLGDILLMPTVGDLQLNPGTAEHPENGYRSRFNHSTEKATPGYYEVMLDDYGIKAQLTATPRTGVHKYTFPKDKDGHLILDLTHGIYNYDGKVLWTSLRVENDTLLTGYRITNGWARTNYTYFAISLSQPIKNYGYKDKEKINYNGFWRRFDVEHNFPEIAGRKVVAYFDFETSKNPELVVKVALSAVSTEGALKNLRAEASGRTFDELAVAARENWNRELDCFQVEGTEDQKAMFYTSLYHTMINPSVYMDVDGKYRGLDHNIHQAEGFTNYTIFSLWDTYRAEHPFLNLIAPRQNADMVESMIKHEQQSVHGMLPVWSLMGNENWCMSGYHGVSVLADAIAKGVYSNVDEALPDWTIYQTALRAGDHETADAYYKRALNYRNIYDPALGFARPRYSDGSFKKEFDVLQTYGEGFIEGNSWNFSFHVPHDVFGLIDVMGGEKAFLDKLDKLFSMHLPEKYYEKNEDITEDCLVGGYVHGNEPSHHVPYLYAWTSQPWKTQYWLREILNKMYQNDINGLGGNDDCGQMSAWYIFSVMGFYPVCPGTDQYVLGAPYLPYLKLTLPNGKVLEIKAEGVSDKNRYVRSLKWNGEAYDKLYITHEDLMQGGVLEFKMSASPNKRRGQKAEDKPYSMTRGVADDKRN